MMCYYWEALYHSAFAHIPAYGRHFLFSEHGNLLECVCYPVVSALFLHTCCILSASGSLSCGTGIRCAGRCIGLPSGGQAGVFSARTGGAGERALGWASEKASGRAVTLRTALAFPACLPALTNFGAPVTFYISYSILPTACPILSANGDDRAGKTVSGGDRQYCLKTWRGRTLADRCRLSGVAFFFCRAENGACLYWRGRLGMAPSMAASVPSAVCGAEK